MYILLRFASSDLPWIKLITYDECIDLCIKRETKLASEFLLVKSSENNFISLPAYYLIIWLMKAKKNFAI